MADLPSYRRAWNQYLSSPTGSFRLEQKPFNLLPEAAEQSENPVWVTETREEWLYPNANPFSNTRWSFLSAVEAQRCWTSDRVQNGSSTCPSAAWKWTFGNGISACGHISIFAAVYQTIASWRSPASTCCCWLLQRSIMIIGVHGSAISAVPSTPCSAPPLLKTTGRRQDSITEDALQRNVCLRFKPAAWNWGKLAADFLPCDPYESRSQKSHTCVKKRQGFPFLLLQFHLFVSVLSLTRTTPGCEEADVEGFCDQVLGLVQTSWFHHHPLKFLHFKAWQPSLIVFWFGGNSGRMEKQKNCYFYANINGETVTSSPPFHPYICCFVLFFRMKKFEMYIQMIALETEVICFWDWNSATTVPTELPTAHFRL